MPTTAENQEWTPKTNPWLIAVVVALAAFMEVLDTSIANVALPHISGNLGASTDQGTWVLTSYLVSNAIVLPITGWISSVMGRKRFFLTCIALFSVSSLLCGLAPSFGFLLCARVLQGAGGGGLQPMAQAIMNDSFPPRLRGLAFAIFGITVIVAPAVGPMLGGWITDNYSWRWIFLINLPVGVITVSLISRLVEDPPFLKRLSPRQLRLDTVGLSMLVIGVGALQIMLDKGQEADWFSSAFITLLAVIAVVCLSFLVLWEWDDKQPVVEMRLFKYLNFSTSSMMIFLAGVISFTAGVLMPQFLQHYLGYTAEDAGLVVSAGAGIMLLTMPIAGALTSVVPVKYLMAVGWLGSGLAMVWSTHHMTMGMSTGTAALMMVVQFAPIAFIFVPAITASYIGVPQDRSDSVSGLSNFMRNIGSSVGTSLVQTVLARRSQFHLARLVDYASRGTAGLAGMIQDLAHSLRSQSAGIGPASAQTAALAQVYQGIGGQASTLSYIDVYYLMGIASFIMLVLSFFLKANDPHHTEQHAAH